MGTIPAEAAKEQRRSRPASNHRQVEKLRGRKEDARGRLLLRARLLFEDAETLLDLGSGVRPFQYLSPRWHVCCDIHREYLRCFHERASIYQHEYYDHLHQSGGQFTFVRGHIAQLPFADYSFDSVVACDVIEHLTHDDGLLLLKDAERVARNQVIVATPVGYYPQIHVEGRPDRWGLNGGYWQAHRSAWVPEEFEDQGYRIVCENDVHFEDGYGNIFERPIGMFWAVKSLSKDAVRLEGIDQDGGLS